MDLILNIMTAMSVIFGFLAYYDKDIIWPTWCAVTMILPTMMLIVLGQRRNLPLSGGVFMIILVMNALILAEFKPATFLPGADIGQIITIKNLAMHAGLEFILLFFSFLFLWKKIRVPLAWSFYVMGLLHSFFLIFDQIVLQIQTGEAAIGFMGNRSIGASFSAVWCFFAIYFAKVFVKNYTNRQWVILSVIVGVVATLISSSGISYAAALLGLMVAWLVVYPSHLVEASMLLAGALATAGYIKPEFWHRNPRYEAWPVFWKFYHLHFPWWFGSGLGTFKFWGPVSQSEYHFSEGRWYLWAHSDWLQIYFELGFFGLIAALWFYFDLLKGSRKSPALLGSLVAFGVVMAGNFPVHIAIFALFGWFLVFEVLFGGKDAIQI